MNKYLFFILPVIIFCSCYHSNSNIPLIIGTYTDKGDEGIYSADFDENTGELKINDSLRTDNPSFIDISGSNNKIYCVKENADNTSAVLSINYDNKIGKMSISNSQPTTASAPCYIKKFRNILMTANYGGSLNFYEINNEGNIEPSFFEYKGDSKGADSIRQNSPHMHSITVMPNKENIIATDFTGDKLIVFNIPKGKDNTPSITQTINIKRGSGPRHITFSKDGKYGYLINEISGEITVLSINSKKINPIQYIKSDTLNAKGSADIHLSPDGKFLYSSNRLKGDGIAIFKISERNGKLTKIGYTLTGKHPRNFTISPNGKYLLVACRDNNYIQIFKVNQRNGLLTDTGKKIYIKKPVCLKFVC